jgi:hypothetical protein
VISGFNTDIKVGNTVYHVQTEDKGTKSRLLLSLVYDKGTILASKRVSYDDVLKGDFDEKKLADFLNKQHQVICAAVSAGRINELKEMTGKARASTKPKPASAQVVLPPPKPAPGKTVAPIDQPSIPIDAPLDGPPMDELILDAVEIIEDDAILSGDAVQVVTDLSGQERAAHSKLTIELLGDAKFKSGDRKTINIMICRGTERKVVANAEIMVKVLGSSFRPVIFHARSDANGLAKVHLQLPKFDAGRAALLIRAIASGEEIELRRLVTPG